MIFYNQKEYWSSDFVKNLIIMISDSPSVFIGSRNYVWFIGEYVSIILPRNWTIL
ncbi:MAG: hypothetical protein QG588_1115 [Candidatus Poribacteria bacterium]|nr:hypothetical protein [Candidatus Poribacteria bacterium]